ncbi:SWIM zinc finger family protein [bacterium]|nr:SWIM zinc finger family protein [bacterium]
MRYGRWPRYVPAAERRDKALKQMEKMRKKGLDIQPVELESRTISRSFWGKAWCKHLESFSDYGNRLPRGRTYVRNGSVCHLEIKAGRIEAYVTGSKPYQVTIAIKPLAAATWETVKEKCRGQIGSMLELLQGKLSDHVMSVVSDRRDGLFPQPGEMDLQCSCPDWAEMCKHVAAALYGVGSRLDSRPELLFILRGVEAAELIAAEIALPMGASSTDDVLADDGLSEIFDIDLEDAPAVGKTTVSAPPAGRRAGKPTSKISPKTSAKGSRKAGSNSKVKVGQAQAGRPTKSPIGKTPKKTAKPSGGKGRVPPVPVSIPKKAASGRPRPTGKRATRRGAAKPAASSPSRRVFDAGAPTGTAIARLRMQTGLSTAKFAELAGVSEASVRRWEAVTGPLRLHARPLAALATLQGDLLG